MFADKDEEMHEKMRKNPPAPREIMRAQGDKNILKRFDAFASAYAVYKVA